MLHEVAKAAFGTVRGLDAERGRFYSDLVVAALGEAARKALEEMMHTGTYDFESQFTRNIMARGIEKGRQEGRRSGRQEGEAKALLQVLDARGLTVSAAAKKRILACSDPARLRTWLRKAVSIEKVSQLFAEPAPKPRPARKPAPRKKR